MSVKKNLFLWLIVLIIIIFPSTITAQITEAKPYKHLVLKGSDELYPSWSPSDSLIIFQSNKKGSFDLYIYRLKDDTVVQITNTPYDEQHPVFFPKNPKLVAYDSDQTGERQLMFLNLNNRRQKPIVPRNIKGAFPSFSPSGNLITFLGYDKITEQLQIFTYDRVYDNLNRLTRSTNEQLFAPHFSPDGKTILFGTIKKTPPYEHRLMEITWYGDTVGTIDSLSADYYDWNQTGFRIIGYSEKKGAHYTIVSGRKDGSFNYRMFYDEHPKASFAISHDGTKMAVAVQFQEDYDLVIFHLTD